MELLIAFILGILIGSFANVVILRIPKDENIAYPASHCFTCNTPLRPWHNIPLFSWIFLRGKCAFCGAKISIQYPLIELISGSIFLITAMKMGMNTASLLTAFTFIALLALSMIDFRYKMVPDSLNLLALFFALLSAVSFHDLTLHFQNALLFAGGFTLLRFALSYLLTVIARKEAKKTQTSWNKHYHTYPFVEALGEADIMIAATMGALLGVKLALFAIFVAAVLALPVMLALLKRPAEEQRLPFIPFLALATFITFVYTLPILNYLDTLYA